LFNSPEGEKEIEGSKLIGIRELKKIADNLVLSCDQMGARPRISITGGNPILHPNFWELLDYIKSLDVKMSLLGNPFGLTDEIAVKIKDHGIDRFQMSLDGMKDFHDHMRKVGSFDATTKACGVLKRNGIDVTIMSTVSKANANEIPTLIKHIVDLGVKNYAFARYCPTHEDVQDMFTPQEYRSFLDTMWQVYSKYVDSGVNFALKDHLWHLYLMEEGMFQPIDTGETIISGCGLGISHLSVLADGSVMACRRFKSVVGNVPEQSFYNIFFSEKMNMYRDYSLLEKCHNCELLNYCRGCMAVTYGSTGKHTSSDPQCWK
jgi:radical SAM/SPASM domain protein of ACGX system